MEPQYYDTLITVLRRAITLILVLVVLVSSAAADDRVVTITSGDDISLFSAGRTPDDDHFDFNAWDIQIFESAAVAGTSLRWHLNPSSERQTDARLAWALPLQEPLGGISLWVKNPNNHTAALRIELIDADGITYRSEGVDLEGELDWRQIHFELAELEPTTADPFPPLNFPVSRFSIVLEGLVTNRPHTIYLDEITGLRPERPELRVEQLRLQTALAPGESMTVRAALSPPEIAERVTLVAEMTTAGGGLIDAAPLRLTGEGGQAVDGSAALRVPEWLPAGRYRVALRSDGARLVGDGAREVPLIIGGAGRPAPAFSLALDFDGPTFVIGDDTLPGVIHELRRGATDAARVLAIPATTDTHPFGWASQVIDEEDGLDFSLLDRRISAALKARPDALIVLQVFLDSSVEWDRSHPDDLQQFSGRSLAPPDLFAGRRTRPDILSPLWQRHASIRLRALIDHVGEAPWGDRVVGYELQAGDIGAWRPWGASAGVGDDAGALRERLFQAWMRDRYGNANELRGSWLGRRRGIGSPGMSFDAVKIPAPLTDGPEQSLYDPAIDQPMIDLAHFRAESPAGALLAMAQLVREEAGPDVLIGAPYGHLLAQARSMDWSWPHLALTQCLESGAFDFLTGPLYRRDAPSLPSSLTASALLAGVAYLERNPSMEPGLASTMAYHGPSPARLAANARGEGIIEVVDDVSARYLSAEGNLPRELLTRPISGSIPHRLHLTRDLIGEQPPRASMYIFRNLFVITPTDGRTLARNTARDRAVLVWVYAPGAISRHLITGRTMEYLTGIKLSHLARTGPLRVEPANRSLRPYGFGAAVSPWFFSADERAEWLGALGGVQGSFSGLALREFGHCTSVFSAAPPTEEIIRHLAQITNTTLPTADAPPGH